FGKSGVAYAVYLPGGVTTNITLPKNETYSVHWFNPRAGGSLRTGSVTSVKGGATVALGRPPAETSLDWVALLRRSGGSGSDDSTGGGGTSTPAPKPPPATNPPAPKPPAPNPPASSTS